MLRLLESVNGDATSYLPQLSVNSNSSRHFLDSVDLSQTLCSYEASSTAANPIHESASFKNLCDLLSLRDNGAKVNSNTSNSHNLAVSNGGKRIKALPPTPLVSPPVTVPPAQNTSILQLTPTRVSTRLIKKKSGQVNVHSTVSAKSGKTDLKRKRSAQYEDETSAEPQPKSNRVLSRKANSTTNSSNENSLDCGGEDGDSNTGDYIYFNNDDDDDDDQESLMYPSSGMRCRSRTDSLNDPLKKESNKEAATRYRLKKLSEKDRLFETRVKLEKDNDQVKKRIELAQTEINYLKNLLVQMLLTKGALNSSNFNSLANIQ
jgi:hypothetical protein